MPTRKSPDSRLLRELRVALAREGDPVRAKKQEAYMSPPKAVERKETTTMPFHGVAAAAVRAVCKQIFADSSWQTPAEWERDVRAIWDGARFREERYAAIALTAVRAAGEFQTPDAIPLYEKIVVEGAWWDFVDEIASNRVGPILRAHPKPMKPLLRAWSKDANMWKRRTSIICQTRFREHTDLDLLYACIEPSLASREFFLRKAIGWALREYAWTDAKEIARYVKTNEARLSTLSKREALKNA